jgi:uncharacterized protein YndB with AHSA1/START domain
MEEDQMFPDRIERIVEITHPADKVWAALTTAEGLNGWFGHKSTIDLRPGGLARMSWEGDEGVHTADMVVKVVEPTSRFAYTWRIMGLPDDDPRRTFVDFTLVPVDGGTRLSVSESGFAQVPDDVFTSAYEGNTGGWTHELGELVAYLDAAS